MTDKKISDIFKNQVSKVKDHALGLIFIIGSIIFHSFSCTQNPALFLDELYYGTRAWAFYRLFFNPTNQQIILNDHPPFGWIFMGIICALIFDQPWMIRVRIFFAIMFACQQILIYAICHKYNHKSAGIIAVIINGFHGGFIINSQIGFLDNIGIVFVLAAFYFLFNHPLNQELEVQQKSKNKFDRTIFPEKKSFYFSGLLFGLAICTKLPFIFFVIGFPAFYLTRQKSLKDTFEKTNLINHIKYWIKWGVFASIPMLIFFIVLIITQKLAYFWGGVIGQLNRYDPNANIYINMKIWIGAEPIFWFCTIFLTVFICVQGIYYLMKKFQQEKASINKKIENKQEKSVDIKDISINTWGFALFCISYIIFLIRGGYILSHYNVPLVPFGCLFIGVFTHEIFHALILYMKDFFDYSQNLRKGKGFRPQNTKESRTTTENHLKNVIIIVAIVWTGFILYPYRYPPLINNPVQGQYEQLAWINENIPKNSTFVVKAFLVAELYELGYPNVQSVGFIDEASFNYDWRNIDYIVTDSLEEATTNFTAPAIDRTVLIYTHIYRIDKSIS